jgi:succinyl-diaminopimelate desuccinylase
MEREACALYKEQISQWVEAHREELIEDIKTLVRIPSDRGNPQPGKPYGEGPAAALAAALQLAEGYGFHVKNYENHVGTVDLRPENDHHLDILSHMDCVPVAQGWTVTEPFDPIVVDGKLYGRGTADDKGPGVAALYAARCVKELGIPLKHNVRLIWGCDEECGSSDIAYYYAQEQEAQYTFSPDADYPVINIEKGGFGGTITGNYPESTALPRVTKVEAGQKLNVVPDRCHTEIQGMRKTVAEIYCAGVTEKTGVHFTITELDKDHIALDAQGVGAHAASPQNGNNAITATLQLLASMHLAPCPQQAALAALAQLLPHGDYLGAGLGVKMSDEASGELTLSLDILAVTPTGLKAQFDSRCPLCATEENMKNVVAKNCAAHGLHLEDTPMRPPHHVPADSPFIQTLLHSYEKYTGVQNAKPLAIGGGTYCHEMKNGVAFGCTMPGTDNHMHGNDEFAVVEELVISAKIFADVIVTLCGE